MNLTSIYQEVLTGRLKGPIKRPHWQKKLTLNPSILHETGGQNMESRHNKDFPMDQGS